MTEGSSEIAPLIQRLGHPFSDEALLFRALTHRSTKTIHVASNERLEFLGDAILGAVVSLHLYAHYPDFQEGRMTKVKSHVVSRRNLASRAKELDLAPHLIVGRMFPTPADISPSILSNAMEAIIGAVFLDAGLEAAHTFVLRHFEASLTAAAEEPGQRDWKSALGMHAQQEGGASPTYRQLSAAGPDHDRTFEFCVVWGERSFSAGFGRSKKDAEQRAARAALLELGRLTEA